MKNNDIQLHQDILDIMHDTYIQKNTAYGDSFSSSFKEFGILSAIVRISDKFNRAKNLAKDKDKTIDVGDETIIDTLLDLANYCILTIMEIRKQDKSNINSEKG